MTGDLVFDQACEVRRVHDEAVSATKSALAEAQTYQSLGALFSALADPTRLRIVHALLERELCTCEIAAALGASDSNVSQHVRILRTLQLVRPRRNGKFVYYRLDDAHVGTIVRMALSHLGHAPSAAAQAS